jgi:chorismate mutase
MAKKKPVSNQSDRSFPSASPKVARSRTARAGKVAPAAGAPDKKAAAQLKRLRAQVDRADRALMKALGARLQAVEKIGQIKREQGMPVLQKARWVEVMAARLKLARHHGVDGEFVSALYELIHREALRIQKP